MPASDTILRRGMKSQRPKSRCGNRPGTSKSADSSDYSNEEHPPRPYQHRPISSTSLDGDVWGRPISHNMAGQIAVSMEENNIQQTENVSTLVQYPRPPSRPPSRPQSRRSRPISSKGRSRSFDVPAVDSDKTPLPHPLRPQSSFSKYKPLPSIGCAAEVESDGGTPTTISHETPNTSTRCDTQINDVCKDLGHLQIHKPPPEPEEDNQTRLKLAVRLLDGSRHERWFRKSDTLGDVLAYAQACSDTPGNLPLCQFCTSEVPRKEFTDMSLTIEDAGILSRSLLHLEEL